MDRHYYFLKLATVIVAVTFAALGGGIDGMRAAHAPGSRTTHNAPIQMQDAAWRVTQSAAHFVVCAASRALHPAASAALL